MWAALAAEFLGMLLFALYGGEARDSAAAYGNGLALAVLVCEFEGGGSCAIGWRGGAAVGVWLLVRRCHQDQRSPTW